MEDTNEIKLTAPPDYVYKNPKYDVYQGIWGNQISFIPERVEYTDQGVFTYFKGIEIPRSGMIVLDGTMEKVNIIKRLLINSIKTLSSKDWILVFIGFGLSKKKILITRILENFNSFADTILNPYYLNDQYYSKSCKEIRLFIREFLIGIGIEYNLSDRFAEIIELIFEEDNAYRWRLQDLMTETTKETFFKDIPKLIKLERERENNPCEVPDKISKFYKIFKLIWFIPSLRKSLKCAILKVDFKNWQLSDSDRIHSLLWSDYNIGGIYLNDRIMMFNRLFNAPQVEIKRPKD